MQAVHCLGCQSYDTENRTLYIGGYQVNDCYNCHSVELETIYIPAPVVDLLSGMGKMVEVKRYNGDLPIEREVKLIEPNCCPICLQGAKSGHERANFEVQTLCRHRFHLDCMRRWLTSHPHNSCPYCRRQAFAWFCQDCVRSYVDR